MNRLKNCLSFALYGSELEQTIVNFGAGIRWFNINTQDEARTGIGRILKESRPQKDATIREDKHTLPQLNKKSVHYLKADKGNNVVIKDKEDYDSVLRDKLSNGNLFKLRNDPLADSNRLRTHSVSNTRFQEYHKIKDSILAMG